MDLGDFFWNLRQQQQIDLANSKVAMAAADARAQESSLADLSRRFDRLALVTQGMFELLAERTHVTDADLAAKIGEIGRRSVAHHPGMETASLACPKCGHASSSHRATCLYCGAPLGSGNPFSGV